MEQYLTKHKPVISSHTPKWLSNFVEVYQELSIDNLDLLETIYHDKVIFIDPIHQVDGFDNLYAYFERLYENLSSCSFTIEQVVAEQEQASLYWVMVYQHSTLNGGNKVTVRGCTHIKAHENRVIYHRDYLDLGAMIYEQVPLLGRLIKWVKVKASR